jgi:hypothetical protein
MFRILLIASLALLVPPGFLKAQELEPRAYASSPIGFGAVLLAYSRLDGGIVFEPTVPIENVDAGINNVAAGYFKSFGLFGRSANVSAVLPYVWGRLSGDVGGTASEITRSGLADARIRLAANLFGAPAMSQEQFIRYRQKTNIGISLTASIPSGQYDPVKLINVGANRWAFKPEVGISHSTSRWLLEGAAGVWILGQNSNFYGGSVRKQSPVVSIQAHAIWNMNRRMWLSADGNFYLGGRAETDGNKGQEQFRNSRLGGAFSYRFRPRHSVGISYNTDAVTHLGGSFRSVAIRYQFTFHQ